MEAALKQYAVYNHPKYGKIYAFEVDGFGNQLLMDDANVPSLIALPLSLIHISFRFVSKLINPRLVLNQKLSDELLRIA